MRYQCTPNAVSVYPKRFSGYKCGIVEGMGKKDIVRYDNELNQISFRNWNGLEQNLFFAVMAKMQGKGLDTVTFSTDDLRDFIDFAGKNGKRWSDVLTNVGRKVAQLVYVDSTPEEIRIMALFQTFVINLTERTMTVKVSENYEYVINKLQAKFTQFELEEFGQLRSTYAKTMYRLLKQWRTVGRREFSSEEFRAYLGVPKSYDGRKITQKVLKPIMAELPAYFDGLALETKHGRGRGHPITGYVFAWKSEKPAGRQWVEGQYAAVEAKKAASRPTPTPPAYRPQEQEKPAATVYGRRTMASEGIVQADIDAHLNGTVAADSCPVCKHDPRNRANHGANQPTLFG
jgi:plasmid replication initiation protein